MSIETQEQLPKDNKKIKNKQKNFKVTRKNSRHHIQLRQFTNPIYAGFQDEEHSNQQHNFGPWLKKQIGTPQIRKFGRQSQFKNNKQQTRFRVNLLKNNLSQNKNWQQTLRKTVSQSNLNIWRKYNQPNSPQNKFRQRQYIKIEKEPIIPSIKSIKFRSVDLGNISKSENLITKSKKKTIWKSELKYFNQGNSYLKSIIKFKLQENHQQQIKVGRVVYNYCYDDELLNLKLNPQILTDCNLQRSHRVIDFFYNKRSFSQTFRNAVNRKTFFNREKLQLIGKNKNK